MHAAASKVLRTRTEKLCFTSPAGSLFIFWFVKISPASHEDIVPSVRFRKEVCQLVDALRDSINVTGMLKRADVGVEWDLKFGIHVPATQTYPNLESVARSRIILLGDLVAVA